MIEATIDNVLDGSLREIIEEARPNMLEDDALLFDEDGRWVGILDNHSQEEWDAWQANKPQIYVVRDGEVVLYVGQSREPESRLIEHLGGWGRYGKTLPSRLGEIVLGNLPASRLWTVELWSCVDCQKNYGHLVNWSDEYEWHRDAAEKIMIRTRRPCLNITYNENGRQLPDRYRKNKLRSLAEIQQVTTKIWR